MFCEEAKLQTKIKLNSKDYPKFNGVSIWCGIGSCFSEKLLLLLEQCGFEVSRNPSGIIYNSYSMQQIITRVVDGNYYSEDDFFEHAGSWHSWEHHGCFSNSDLKEALKNVNLALKNFRACLKNADALILTPSSSVVYCHGGEIVANCHKVDNKRFARRILSSGENREFLAEAVEKILKLNAKCKIIFTLSPVRHYPGDLVLNARSKANLLSALHEVCAEFPERCVYFPAYEILHDELRDYRFYKPDLLHPSEPAVQLICGRFIKIFFEAAAVDTMEKTLAAVKLRNHRPLK